MNVMYIVGNGSTHNDTELRYSLRALAKYGRNVDRLIVAGIPPAFLSAKVEKIAIDPVELRGRNRTITNNVLQGVKRAGLHGDFVLGIDDVFLVKPVDMNEYPRFFDAYDLRRQGSGGWYAAMNETRNWLHSRKLPTVDFMTHAHARLSADVINEHFAELNSTITDTERGLEIITVVSNMTLAADPRLKMSIRRDIKLGEQFVEPGEDDIMFSISDRTFGDPMFLNWMRREFPEPSPWEI